MKRKVFSLILCLLMLSSLFLAAGASSYLPMVIDSADLLSGEERTDLEDKAQELRTEYEMDVVILTVDTLDGKSAQNYADDYYDDNGYGYGEDYSGILFLLAMEEREWYISTCGDAIYAFTDYGLEQLGENVVPFLSTGLYYEAFVTYLVLLPDYFDAYRDGQPIDGHADDSGDYYHGEQEQVVYYDSNKAPSLAISLVIGFVTALVAVLIMRGAMNTKRPQRSAGDYLKPGSFHLRTHQDMFLYSQVHKVRKQQSNSGGNGGGSSIHRSSSGRSHGGGGGRF